MYEFLDRLMNLALPRVRDFRGVSAKAFDGRGNYTLGIRDQLIFPEINYNKVQKVKGMNVCIVTTARTDEEAQGAAGRSGYAVSQGSIAGARVPDEAEVRDVATKAWMAKNRRKPKFAVRQRNRCERCGRPRGFCASSGCAGSVSGALALEGMLPGVTKSSW